MELLTAVFSRLLSMALMALPVMAVVFLTRLAMARLRVPRKYSCALWFAVGARLVCPVSLRGLLSIFDLPGLYDLAEATGSVDGGVVTALPPVTAAMAPPSSTATALPPPSAMEGTVTVSAVASPSAGEIVLMVASVAWLLGVLAMLLWGAAGMVRLKRRVSQAVWTGGEVWECGEIPTPFVLGFFRPRIYIRPGLTGMERTCVLVHERHHIRRGDPWWKLLAWCILAVYWWNPAVWLCWMFFCRDLEMSCDEAVLATLGDQAKRGYSLSLVENAAERPIPMALAFGEHDATRRVKNVLKWQKETPRVAFLAAAAVLVVVSVCLNGASERTDSWVRLEEGNGSDTRTFTYRIGKEYQSYLLYAEVYDHETLLSRTILDCWPLGEDWPDGQQPDPGPDGTVTEARSRRGIATLRAELMWRGDGTGTDMQWWGTVSTASGGTMGTNLGQGLVPEQPYHLMMWGTLCTETGERVELGEDTAVAVACLSTSPDGSIYAFDVPRGTDWPDAALRNDVTMVLRLRLSTQDAASLRASFEAEQGGFAQTLFALHTSVLDAGTAAAMLETMDTASLGTYTETYQPQQHALDVAFSQQPADADALDRAMMDRGTLLLALAEDLEEVRWSYPVTGNGGETTTTVYWDRSQPDGWARNLGYEDLRELGRTTEGIQALLEYLGWSEGESSLAQALYSLRTDVTVDSLPQLRQAVSLLGLADKWSSDWELTAKGETADTLELDMGALTLNGQDQELEADLRKTAMVLLALQENLHSVQWSYGGMNPDGVSNPLDHGQEFTASDADTWLDLSSSMIAQAGGIKALGSSPEGIQALLDFLGISGGEITDGETADAIFQLAGEQSPEALAETLVCSGPWGDVALEGTFAVSEKEGQLLLEFTQPNAWTLAADGNRMAASATVLLALYPELIQVQARSVNGESFYIRATRETAIRLLTGGKTLSDYGASPEALAELFTLLNGIVERDGLLTGMPPDGAVPYPASGGFVAQYRTSLPLGAETAALEAVTYCEGREMGRQVVWRGSPLELPSDGFWLQEYPQRSSGGWGPVEFTLMPWTDDPNGAGEPLASWTMELPSGFHYDSREQRSVENAVELEKNTSAVLFAAAFSDTGDFPPAQEMQLPAAEKLNDPAVLGRTLEEWNAVILVELRLES